MSNSENNDTPVWRARSSLVFYGVVALLGAAATIGFQAWPIAISFAIGLPLMAATTKGLEQLIYGPKDD